MCSHRRCLHLGLIARSVLEHALKRRFDVLDLLLFVVLCSGWPPNDLPCTIPDLPTFMFDRFIQSLVTFQVLLVSFAIQFATSCHRIPFKVPFRLLGRHDRILNRMTSLQILLRK